MKRRDRRGKLSTTESLQTEAEENWRCGQKEAKTSRRGKRKCSMFSSQGDAKDWRWGKDARQVKKLSGKRARITNNKGFQRERRRMCDGRKKKKMEWTISPSTSDEFFEVRKGLDGRQNYFKELLLNIVWKNPIDKFQLPQWTKTRKAAGESLKEGQKLIQIDDWERGRWMLSKKCHLDRNEKDGVKRVTMKLSAKDLRIIRLIGTKTLAEAEKGQLLTRRKRG